MYQQTDELIQTEEKKLIGTMITGKPSINAYLISMATVITMLVVTLFYWNAPQDWAQLLSVSKNQIFQQGQLWRIFTAIFIHSDIEHLLSNMLLLWFFSYFIFGYFGFKMYPVVSFFMAGLVNGLAIWTYEPSVQLMGASGLVYLLGGLWLALYAQIQRQYAIGQRLLRVIGIAFMIFLPSTFMPSTSYRTHAIGFFVGILTGLLYFFKNKKQIRSQEIYLTNPKDID